MSYITPMALLQYPLLAIAHLLLLLLPILGLPPEALAHRLVRSHVMRQVGKSRRKGRPVKATPLEFPLEIPDEPFWDEANFQRPPNPPNHLLNQSTADRLDESPGQGPDTGSSLLSFEASSVPPHSINRFQQRITQPSHNPRQLPEADPSESLRRQNEQIIARIERLWVGRSDPFARYPIEMNLRAHELIDHIQYPIKET